MKKVTSIKIVKEWDLSSCPIGEISFYENAKIDNLYKYDIRFGGSLEDGIEKFKFEDGAFIASLCIARNEYKNKAIIKFYLRNILLKILKWTE